MPITSKIQCSFCCLCKQYHTTAKAAPSIYPSSSLGYLFGMKTSVLRGLQDGVSDMLGLKVCVEQVNGVVV